ncbi:MAG: hypothetical protein ABID45_04710 [Patescibacteria group bacterium]
MKSKKFNWIKITNQNKDWLIKRACANTRKFLEAALKLGYKVEYLSYFFTLRITHKGVTKNIVNVATSLNNQSAYRLANNKFLTDSVWQQNGVYCSNFSLITKKMLAENKLDLQGLKYPLVIKPAKDTTHGEMVVTNIVSAIELKKYAKKILKKHQAALVEEFHKDLFEYRILVYKSKIMAVAKKVPANVTGNGKDNIKALIVKKNIVRQKFRKHNLMPIKIDDDLKKKLKEQKLTLSSKLKKGQNIQLKNVGNLCAGGEVLTINNIHPLVEKMALKAARVLDLDLVGLDLLAKDVTKPLKKGRDIFLEANETPGINLHFDWEKKEMPPIAEKIMKELFK